MLQSNLLSIRHSQKSHLSVAGITGLFRYKGEVPHKLLHVWAGIKIILLLWQNSVIVVAITGTHKNLGQEYYQISEVLWASLLCIPYLMIESKPHKIINFVPFCTRKLHRGSSPFYYMHEVCKPICNQNINAFIKMTLSYIQVAKSLITHNLHQLWQWHLHQVHSLLSLKLSHCSCMWWME